MLTEKCSHRMHINDMLQGQITNPSQGYTCYREAGIVNTKITFNDHSIYTHTRLLHATMFQIKT